MHAQRASALRAMILTHSVVIERFSMFTFAECTQTDHTPNVIRNDCNAHAQQLSTIRHTHASIRCIVAIGVAFAASFRLQVLVR